MSETINLDDVVVKCNNCENPFENGDIIVHEPIQGLVFHTNWHSVDGDVHPMADTSCFDRYGAGHNKAMVADKGMYWNGRQVTLPVESTLDGKRAVYQRVPNGHGAKFYVLEERGISYINDAIEKGIWPTAHDFRKS